MEEDKKEASTFLGRYDRQPIVRPLLWPLEDFGAHGQKADNICYCWPIFAGYYLAGIIYSSMKASMKALHSTISISPLKSETISSASRCFHLRRLVYLRVSQPFALFIYSSVGFNGEKNGRISFLAQFSHSVLGRSFNRDGYLLSLFWSVWLSILLFQFIICFLERFLLF